MHKKKTKNDHPTIDNRQARFKYSIDETFEAGLELRGSEVKSIRASQVSLKEGYVSIKKGEMFLLGVHIAPYEQAGTFNQHEPIRNIRLLMHKREILKLGIKIDHDRFALVPLKMYFKGGKVKIQLGLGKGKKLHDKREDIKQKDIERSLRQKYKL